MLPSVRKLSTEKELYTNQHSIETLSSVVSQQILAKQYFCLISTKPLANEPASSCQQKLPLSIIIKLVHNTTSGLIEINPFLQLRILFHVSNYFLFFHMGPLIQIQRNSPNCT